MQRKKNNKKISELNNTIDEMDLTDIYRLFHSMAEDYTFHSESHGTFPKTDHIIGHKASLNK
jgi:exonuclease III